MEGGLLCTPTTEILSTSNGSASIFLRKVHQPVLSRFTKESFANSSQDDPFVPLSEKLRFLYESVRINNRDSCYSHYIQSVQLICENPQLLLLTPTSASILSRNTLNKNAGASTGIRTLAKDLISSKSDDYIPLSTLFSPHLDGLRSLTNYFQNVRHYDEKQVIVLRRIGPLGFENGMILFDRLTAICSDLSDETALSDNGDSVLSSDSLCESHACVVDFQLLPCCPTARSDGAKCLSSTTDSLELKPSTVAFVALNSVDIAQKFLAKYRNSGLFVRNFHVLVSSFTY